MKIISPFKDFYDFAVTTYGLDNQLVYHRLTRVWSNAPHGEHNRGRGARGYRHRLLLVGDKTVHLFNAGQKTYSHLDLIDLSCLKDGLRQNPFFHFWQYEENKPLLTFQDGTAFTLLEPHVCHDYGFGARLYAMLFLDREALLTLFLEDCFKGEEDSFFVNKQEKETFLKTPIILLDYVDRVQDFEKRKSYFCYQCTYNPNLQTCGIYLEPNLIWQALVSFLSRARQTQETPVQVSNTDKIEAHGFDVKTSFRTKMKPSRDKNPTT